MNDRTDLAHRMTARADADRLPADHELRTLARTLEETVHGFYSEPQTHALPQTLGAWARARKAWCAYTGEALV